MKSTVDVPDELYRMVKSRAAAEGLTVREVTIDLYQGWVASARAEIVTGREWLERWVSLGRSAPEGVSQARTVRNLMEEDRGRLER